MSSLEILAMVIGMGVGTIMILYGVSCGWDNFKNRKRKKYQYYIAFIGTKNCYGTLSLDYSFHSCEILRKHKIKTFDDINDLCQVMQDKYGYKKVIIYTIHKMSRTRRYAE